MGYFFLIPSFFFLAVFLIYPMIKEYGYELYGLEWI